MRLGAPPPPPEPRAHQLLQGQQCLVGEEIDHDVQCGTRLGDRAVGRYRGQTAAGVGGIR
jgi:hypothetical protein